ncbi:Hcp family type VI secretion system effector [Burkholderia dolosa]|uniref:Hcp family type VI secretion system effector n=1 Tax=Burkholderia dolosa TaxID=152500 RepID=UPI0015911C76|nr:type VI secretion system tube protein Hcp [Burkholderia dolosa]MBY4754038.1 type VI secretion system tube protein Hcp [Burkholderia dolosa]
MAQDIFLKLTGIHGESTDRSHPNEIEVLTWGWTATQQSGLHVGSGGGVAKCTVADLTFEHYVDRATPNLIQCCLTGRHLDSAVLVMRKVGSKPLEYLKITMEHVLVTAVTPASNLNMRGPREEVRLSFARMMEEYVVQSPQGGHAGTVRMGYDIRAGKAI